MFSSLENSEARKNAEKLEAVSRDLACTLAATGEVSRQDGAVCKDLSFSVLAS